MGRWARAVVVMAVVVGTAFVAEGSSAAAVAPPSGKVYAGVTVDGALGMVPELDAYTGSAGGKRPSVVMDYRDRAHNPNFPTDFADLVVGRGATPIVRARVPARRHPLPRKPLMIAEIGSAEQGGDKAAWIKDFFSRLVARPDVRGFVWFNHDKEADWRVQSSDASRISYAAAVAVSRYA